MLIYVSDFPLFAQEKLEKQFLNWSELPQLPPAPGNSVQLGVAGPFAGISNDALIVAGGANFPQPVWETEKKYYDQIYVLTKQQNLEGKIDFSWENNFKLDFPVAYGASVTTPYGVVCMGGSDGKQVFSKVLLLNWNPAQNKIDIIYLPDLPLPYAYGYATFIDNTIYLAGGQQELGLESAMKNFWALDLSEFEKSGVDNLKWQQLPAWPGPTRALNITVAQHNGETNCIYVISGRRSNQNGDMEFLRDVYEFNPTKYDPQCFNPKTKGYSGHGRFANPWRKKADALLPVWYLYRRLPHSKTSRRVQAEKYSQTSNVR